MGRVQAKRPSAHHRARAAKVAAVAAALVPFVSGCSVDEVLRFGWPEGVTPQAEAMRELWTYSAIAALVVGAVTWAAMFWAMAFHRKRKGDDGSVPRQTQYNLPVEVVFTAVPTIIVAVLFGFTVVVQNYVDDHRPDPQLSIGIEAFQWNWEFFYFQPGTQRLDTPAAGRDPADREAALQAAKDTAVASTLGTSTEIPILVLPTGRRIEFTQSANDVIHSFFVPEFLFKRDVFPLPYVNDQDYVWQIDQITEPGAFVGRCAELCGSYHSMMNFEVRALPGELFDQWLLLRTQVNPVSGVPFTTAEALQELQNRGCDARLCAPLATSTSPFPTNREQRDAVQPITSGR